MACNCGKATKASAPPPGEEYVVITKDGQTTTGYESQMQAVIAAAKLGGVVKTQPVQ